MIRLFNILAVDDNTVLSSIHSQIDANGQIVVKPDMSRDIPYRIETLREAKGK